MKWILIIYIIQGTAGNGNQIEALDTKFSTEGACITAGAVWAAQRSRGFHYVCLPDRLR